MILLNPQPRPAKSARVAAGFQACRGFDGEVFNNPQLSGRYHLSVSLGELRSAWSKQAWNKVRGGNEVQQCTSAN